MKFETNFLLQKMRDLKPGDIATYNDMSEWIGSDINRSRHALSSAISILLRDYGLIYTCIRGVGYQLQAKKDAAAIVDSRNTSRLKNTVKRFSEELRGVDYKALDSQGKEVFIRSHARLSITEAAIDESCVKQVKDTAVVRGGSIKFDRSSVLKMLVPGVG